MKVINKLSLEKHDGEYTDWPLKSTLLVDGKPTKTKLPGYKMLCSIQLKDDRILVVIDYDCPFEEQATAVLLNSDYKILTKKLFPSGVLIDGSSIIAKSEKCFEVKTFGSENFSVKILNKRLFFWKSLIEIEFVKV
tara:strand:+ start:523 stop:930 length:408 start_codon:yes stop_codon:yes gene_type:complete